MAITLTHIDKYIKDLISNLRENNVDISRVYSIIGSLFGRMENVLFTKRCLRTLSAKLNREHADNDVMKILEVFAQISAEDVNFTYRVQVDSLSRVKTIMWSNGSSRRDIKDFGDVIKLIVPTCMTCHLDCLLVLTTIFRVLFSVVCS